MYRRIDWTVAWLCAGNAAGYFTMLCKRTAGMLSNFSTNTSEIDSMNESTQDGSTYSYLGKAIAGWARHVSKVRGKETAGSKNRNSKNRQFFEGIRKYRIYISLRGRRNVWTGK